MISAAAAAASISFRPCVVSLPMCGAVWCCVVRCVLSNSGRPAQQVCVELGVDRILTSGQVRATLTLLPSSHQFIMHCTAPLLLHVCLPARLHRLTVRESSFLFFCMHCHCTCDLRGDACGPTTNKNKNKNNKQAQSAGDGVGVIASMVEAAHGSALQIMAGGGCRPSNVGAIVRRTGVREIHGTGACMPPVAKGMSPRLLA